MRGWQKGLSVVLLLLGVFFAAAFVYSLIGPFDWLPDPLWRTLRIGPQQIRHEIGNAYIADLGYPTFSSQFQPSVARVLESGKPLFAGNVYHQDIRNSGGGRYSFWGTEVYFSASDNSNPLENGRSYSIQVPFFITAPWVPRIVFLFVLTWLAIIILMGRQVIAVPDGWVRSSNWLARNVMPGVLLTVGILALLLGFGEGYLRLTKPFLKSTWPNEFNERYGFRHEPGVAVNWTNWADYWTSTQANSIGFLDREPPASKASNTCRVLFIGDSFIEAPQLPIDKKIQVQFENLARQLPTMDRRIETMALGYSGSGQSSELPFYDTFAEPFDPEVVVLVFVGNDFSNNSPYLDAAIQGWDPLRPPRFYFRRDETSGAFVPIPIEPKWLDFLLPPPPDGAPLGVVHSLSQESYLYNWLFANAFAGSPQLSGWLKGSPPSLADSYDYRMKQIILRHGRADSWGGWDPRKIDMDVMFTKPELPPVFQDALVLTGHAFDEFQIRTQRDGVKLLVLAASQVSTVGGEGSSRGQYQRLSQLLADRHIPLIDQYGYILSKGYSLADVSFKHDGHWSEKGHRWAAEALLEYFQTHPEICAK